MIHRYSTASIARIILDPAARWATPPNASTLSETRSFQHRTDRPAALDVQMVLVENMVGIRHRFRQVDVTGAGFRSKIRKQFIEKDLIEAVIGLPSNLFYNTGSPGCLLLFNDNKSEDRKGKVLFIDASKDYLDGKNQNHLRDEDILKTAEAFDSFETVERYCTISNFKEIEDNDFNLNISRYVDTTEPEEQVDIKKVLSNLNTLETERDEIQNRLNGYLKELDI